MREWEITAETVFSVLKKRPEDANKGDFGRLTVVGGSRRFRGAPILAVSGALRCGCGIVSLASLECVIEAAAVRCPECTFFPLLETPDDASGNGVNGAENSEMLLQNLACGGAAVIGCGMGWCYSTSFLCEAVLRGYSGALLLDADALNALSDRPELLLEAKRTPIVTPHPGEFSRLCGRPIGEVLSDGAALVRDFSARYRCITVLKGHRTLIALPDGALLRNTTGNAGLARGGSGDLLAGMIGAFLAQCYAPADAARCGVFLHGLAADRCAARLSQYGMLVSDILPDLCAIFAENGL